MRGNSDERDITNVPLQGGQDDKMTEKGTHERLKRIAVL